MTDAERSLNPRSPDSGDPRAWAIPRDEAIPRLLDIHGGQLFGLSSRICASREEAEDLVQEVFLNAWRSWDDFRGESSPRVWLFTIARHACQRMHRRRAGEPETVESLETLLPFGEPELAFVPEDADPLSLQIRAESRAEVERAIAQLPTEFRMPLILKEIVGLSLAEIAQVFDLPEATVKTRVHRARLKIRQAIEKGLPRRSVPPTPYGKQVCLDLLDAKQNALDHGLDIAAYDRELCGRCDVMFSTLDFATEQTRALASSAALPDEVRRRLLERWQANGS